MNISIVSLLPQRAPFVMVDHLTGFDEKIARGSFLVKKDNIFVEEGRFSEPGLVENIAQTAAARSGYASVLENKPAQVGYIGAIKNLVIHALPLVGDELVTEITVEDQIFNVTLIKGSVSCNKKLLAECQMKIYLSQSK